MRYSFNKFPSNILFKNIRGKKYSVDRFVKHNKRVFQRSKGNSTDSRVILLELNNMNSSIISYSYLADVLVRTWGGKIIAYLPTEEMGRNYLW